MDQFEPNNNLHYSQEEWDIELINTSYRKNKDQFSHDRITSPKSEV